MPNKQLSLTLIKYYKHIESTFQKLFFNDIITNNTISTLGKITENVKAIGKENINPMSENAIQQHRLS